MGGMCTLYFNYHRVGLVVKNHHLRSAIFFLICKQFIHKHKPIVQYSSVPANDIIEYHNLANEILAHGSKQGGKFQTL